MYKMVLWCAILVKLGEKKHLITTVTAYWSPHIHNTHTRILTFSNDISNLPLFTTLKSSLQTRVQFH